jgi:DNA-binding transcriptional LysR family regulator
MRRKAHLGRVSDVDIRLLRIFRAVAACGGVAAAELELNIGRSTISRHLTDLELRLGVKLCDRGPAGFALTDEGELVLEASSRLMSAINSFQSDIDKVHQRLSGHLSLALFDKTVTNPEARLPEAFTLFDEIAPEVTVEIHAVAVNVIENEVMTGHFDLAIIPIHRQSNSLHYYPLYPEQMYLYCGETHALFDRADESISQREICKYKYAGIGFHSPNMMVSHRLNLRRNADVYDEEALAALILSGRYVGFLPDHYAKRFVERGALRRLRPDVYRYRSDHAAIVRRSPRPTPMVAEFLDCLRRAHGTGKESV